MSIFLFLLSLLISVALGQEPITTPPNNIEVVRVTQNPYSASTAAILLWCSPNRQNGFGGKVNLLGLSFEAETRELAETLRRRSDVNTLVVMNNPTSAEATEWFLSQIFALSGNDPYGEIIVFVACPATGGDTDEEILFMRDSNDPSTGLSFIDLANSVGKMSSSSIWLIDASRDITAAMDTGATSFGPTADDITKATVPDALAISTGTTGRYANGGLISAAAKTISESQGRKLTLEGLYYQGIKPKVPRLDLATSMGIKPNDAWDQNMNRLVFIGGPLITDAPISTKAESKESRKLTMRPKHVLVAGGGAGLLTGVAFAIQAGSNYRTLVEYDQNGGETEKELRTAVDSYLRNRNLAIGLGTAGALATAGGITWMVIDSKMTVAPTGNGVAVTGRW